jgi:hypothetical protein
MWLSGGPALAARPENVVRCEAGRERRTLFSGMAEAAIAAASFLKKRYSGKRGSRETRKASQKKPEKNP